MTEEERDRLMALLTEAQDVMDAIIQREERPLWGTNYGPTRTERGRYMDNVRAGITEALWNVACAAGECPSVTA